MIGFSVIVRGPTTGALPSAVPLRPGERTVFGRRETLPGAQRLPDHKYLSRDHLAFELVDGLPGSRGHQVVMYQMGKNPTFSSGCPMTKASNKDAQECLRLDQDSCKVSLQDTELLRAHSSVGGTEGTLFYFPSDFGLPTLTVVYRSPPRLEVPTDMGKYFNDDSDTQDEEEKDAPKKRIEVIERLASLREERSLSASKLLPQPSAEFTRPSRDQHDDLPPRGEMTSHRAYTEATSSTSEQNSLSDEVKDVAKVVEPRWYWKSRIGLGDGDRRAWTPYDPHVGGKIEAAYTKNGGAAATFVLDKTYAIAFDDADQGMVQFRRDDQDRWRPVKREGPAVARANKKMVRIIRQDDTSDNASLDVDDSDESIGEYRKDSFLVDDSDDSDSDSDSSEYSSSDESSSFVSSESTSSSVRKGRKRRGAGRGRGGRGGRGASPPRKKPRYEE